MDSKTIKEHAALEIDIEGEGEGAFYIELDNGFAVVEPYEYYDNDCKIRANADTFSELLTGKLDAGAALADGRLAIEGNIEKAIILAEALKSAVAKKSTSAKKPAAKKTASSAKKPATKKPTAKKKA